MFTAQHSCICMISFRCVYNIVWQADFGSTGSQGGTIKETCTGLLFVKFSEPKICKIWTIWELSAQTSIVLNVVKGCWKIMSILQGSQSSERYGLERTLHSLSLRGGCWFGWMAAQRFLCSYHICSIQGEDRMPTFRTILLEPELQGETRLLIRKVLYLNSSIGQFKSLYFGLLTLGWLEDQSLFFNVCDRNTLIYLRASLYSCYVQTYDVYANNTPHVRRIRTSL